MTKEAAALTEIAEAEALLEKAECLLTAEEVDVVIADLAKAIEKQIGDRFPLVICTMIGGVVLTGKLLPLLNFPLELDYVHVTRYGDKTSGGELAWLARPTRDLKNRTVLILDDIFDEGNTLVALKEFGVSESAAAVYTAVLVNKLHERKDPKAALPDFIGVELEDRYLFGYGMDCAGLWRNAPGIYALDLNE